MINESYNINLLSKHDQIIYAPLLAKLPYDEQLQKLFEEFKRDIRRQKRNDERHLDERELSDALWNEKGDLLQQDDVGDIVAIREEQNTLIGMLKKLSPVAKRRVILCYFNELSHEEIARMEDVSQQSVTESIKWALKKLKKIHGDTL
ncbi:hypothetical protein LJC07_06540 [Christensenellaceae bacterium OttesenSCG-928-L17]|nr:hypothetical protein [Christensenellaceae bacterium OttesenSCG-928-L17]